MYLCIYKMSETKILGPSLPLARGAAADDKSTAPAVSERPVSKCKAITQGNGRCSRNALSSGFCKQHDKDYKITMYKKELAKMHERVRFYVEKTTRFNEMIIDIQRCDYIKLHLTRINGGEGRAYRYVITDPRYKDQIEELFDLPIDEVLPAYFNMLQRRNEIVHKYTMGEWEDGPIPKVARKRYSFSKPNIKYNDKYTS